MKNPHFEIKNSKDLVVLCPPQTHPRAASSDTSDLQRDYFEFLISNSESPTLTSSQPL